MCATGTAWGKLKERDEQLGFWIFRHACYLGITLPLLLVEPVASTPVGYVILFTGFFLGHTWKIVAVLIRSIRESQKKKAKISAVQDDGKEHHTSLAALPIIPSPGATPPTPAVSAPPSPPAAGSATSPGFHCV